MSGYVFLGSRKVKARKLHVCIWCGQDIRVGDKYVYENSIYDGRYQNHHWHPECEADAQVYFLDSGDYEFSPGENERPRVSP